jgi:hypothetical protein
MSGRPLVSVTGMQSRRVLETEIEIRRVVEVDI